MKENNDFNVNNSNNKYNSYYELIYIMYINDPLLKLKRGNKLVKSQSERRKKLVEQKKSPDD